MISIYLAKVFGVYLIIIGLAYLYRGEEFKAVAQEYSRNPAIVTFFSIFSLLIGLGLAIGHNVWVLSWPLFITLIAYLAIVKGISGLLFPEYLKVYSRKMLQGRRTLYIGIVAILLGVWLSYQGFINQ